MFSLIGKKDLARQREAQIWSPRGRKECGLGPAVWIRGARKSLQGHLVSASLTWRVRKGRFKEFKDLVKVRQMVAEPDLGLSFLRWRLL